MQWGCRRAAEGRRAAPTSGKLWAWLARLRRAGSLRAARVAGARACWSRKDMSTAPSNSEPLRFGRAELRRVERQLLIDGQPVPLGARAFDVLNLLIEQRGRVVAKEELLAAAWPGVVVEENNLQVQISTLRKLLGAGVITTVAGQGYQFTATLDAERGTAPASAGAGGPGPAAAPPPAVPARSPAPDASGHEEPDSGGLGRWASRIVILLGVVAVLASLWVFTRPRTHDAPAPGAPAAAGVAAGNSIAVLPFVDLSEKKDQEYFSDGLSEALIDLLTQIPDLRVPARTSCFYFKGKSEDITEIARKLRVAHVLEGSVRKSGNTIRVTAQLIRADNGYHIWSETFEHDLTDVFKVQDEIARSVVGALRITMVPGSVRLEPAPANIDAYTLLLQGRFAAARSNEADMQRAVELFEQSAKLDPNYAAAWAEIAGTRRWLADFVDPSPDDNVARARAAALKALSLNPDSVKAHLVLAIIYQNYDRDWNKAEAEVDTAERLEPNNVPTLAVRGFRSFISGDQGAAIPRLVAVLDRDPFDAGNYRFLALARLAHGDLAEAERTIRRGLEVSPRMVAGSFALARILVARHAGAEALAAAQQEPQSLYRRTALAVAYRLVGREADSRAQLDELIARDAAGAAYQIAEVQAYRGDREAMLQWLQRAYVQHDSGLQALKVDPFFHDYRDEPQVRELIRKAGLPL
jgi:adenylate cyclase